MRRLTHCANREAGHLANFGSLVAVRQAANRTDADFEHSRADKEARDGGSRVVATSSANCSTGDGTSCAANSRAEVAQHPGTPGKLHTEWINGWPVLQEHTRLRLFSAM